MNAPAWSLPPKPVTVAGNLAALPDVFAPYLAKRVWVGWRWQWNGKKWTKPPFHPNGQWKASSTNPETWNSYSVVLAAVQAGTLDGLGLALEGLSGNEIALDLDGCRDPVKGRIDPWAQEIVDEAASYTEVSPSGTGLRVIGRGTGGKHTSFKNVHPGGGGVEIFPAGFDAGRYITVTGKELPGCWPHFSDITDVTLRLIDGRGRLHPEQPASTPQNGYEQAPAYQARPGGLAAQLGFLSAGNELVGLIRHGVPVGRRSEQFFHAVGLARREGWTLKKLEREMRSNPNGIAAKYLSPSDRLTNQIATCWGKVQAPTSEAPISLQRPSGLVSFADFVGSIRPPHYLIQSILQGGWLYSITAPTGAGKTAVALDLAIRVAEGKPLGTLETAKGRVVYLSGENPEDVKARCLMLSKRHRVTAPDIYFLEGAIRLEEHIKWLIAEIEAVGGASLVIVDTSASYFGGDDDNSNVELGEYARLFRQICKMDCQPTVLVLAHPTKKAAKDNLLPRGGGAFLNEVDGNLTLWTDDQVITTLHWQGKFRGPDFEPIQFRLEQVRDEQFIDSQGRSLPSVIALPIDFTQAEKLEEENHKQEDRVLLSFGDRPELSIRDRARLLGFVNDKGQPLKGRVERVVARLVEERLLTQNRKKEYRLTDAGKREVDVLRGVSS
jgi:hypothetical protein